MRIALYHNLTSGGSKREAFEFAKQFVKHGDWLDLCCPHTANEEFLPLTKLARQDFIFDLQSAGEFKGRLPFLRKYVDLYRLKKNLRRSRTLAKRIAEKIDAANYDFVFVHHDQPVQSPYLLKFLRTPSVYYCAEPMREFYEPPIDRPYLHPTSLTDRIQHYWYAPTRWLRRSLITRADRHNIRRARLLLTNSFFSAECIHHVYALRARVVHLGVDVEKFRPLDMPRQNFVLSVGAISPLKGFDFLIEALSRVPEGLRPALVLVGNTASQGETRFLEQLARARDVDLHMRVNIGDEELVCLYNRARAFVYSPVREPFGLAPLEAMACETPVVAVKEGGVCESVRGEETGLLVPRNVDQFAAAVTRILCDFELAERLGKSGRRCVVECWTWESAYSRFVASIIPLLLEN